MSKELFVPNHKNLTDEVLLLPPADGPLTELKLFVCTYVARLTNLHIGFAELTRLMCIQPHGCLLAINSNHGHAAQPGQAGYLKKRKPVPERRVPTRGRPRAVQGDGTCFNSAVEPVIAIDHPDIADDKVYFVKCFPTTGETQVPGVILPDLSDGHIVLETFVDYLNELEVGDPETPITEENPTPPRKLITIEREQPKMINFKFRLVRNSPRILVNLYALASYLFLLETTKVVDSVVVTPAKAAKFAGWPVIVLPPFPVREMKSPTDDVKVSFRFEEADRSPRINIFQSGKINILGADSMNSAALIYEFFVRLFTDNWSNLVTLQPRRDLERRQVSHGASRVSPAVPLPPKTPVVTLSDAEVDLVLDDVLIYADEMLAVSENIKQNDWQEDYELSTRLAGKPSGPVWRHHNVASNDDDGEPDDTPREENIAAVNDIVAALDEFVEWGDEDATEDDENVDQLAPMMAAITLQDAMLCEVDGEDVEQN